MISRAIGITICRVGAVLLLIQTIQSVVYTLQTVQDSLLGVPDFLQTAALMAFSPLVGAIVLWFFAGQISAAGADSDDAIGELSIDRADIFAAATYLLGIFLLAFAIVDAVTAAVLAMYPRLYPETAGLVDSVPNPQLFARQVGNAVQATIGVGLILIGRRNR